MVYNRIIFGNMGCKGLLFSWVIWGHVALAQKTICLSIFPNYVLLHIYSVYLVKLFVKCLGVIFTSSVFKKNPLFGLSQGGFEGITLCFSIVSYVWAYGGFWTTYVRIYGRNHVKRKGNTHLVRSNDHCSTTHVFLTPAGLHFNLVG